MYIFGPNSNFVDACSSVKGSCNMTQQQPVELSCFAPYFLRDSSSVDNHQMVLITLCCSRKTSGKAEKCWHRPIWLIVSSETKILPASLSFLSNSLSKASVLWEHFLKEILVHNRWGSRRRRCVCVCVRYDSTVQYYSCSKSLTFDTDYIVFPGNNIISGSRHLSLWLELNSVGISH